MIIPPIDTFDLLQDLRNTRDAFLRESDWTQVPDSPLSDSKKAEWATYRQTLRLQANNHKHELRISNVGLARWQLQ